MIKIEEAKNNLGRAVKYIPFSGCSSDQVQHGIIHSVNDRYIFVSFGNRTMGRGEACRPDDLEWENK